jgi:hypothetical protein
MAKRRKRYPRKRKELYKVLWSYEDSIGLDSGVLDVYATSHKDAEEIFYKNNRGLVKVVDGKPVFNPAGGYTVEGVLTEAEWVREGRLQRV